MHYNIILFRKSRWNQKRYESHDRPNGFHSQSFGLGVVLHCRDRKHWQANLSSVHSFGDTAKKAPSSSALTFWYHLIRCFLPFSIRKEGNTYPSAATASIAVMDSRDPSCLAWYRYEGLFYNFVWTWAFPELRYRHRATPPPNTHTHTQCLIVCAYLQWQWLTRHIVTMFQKIALEKWRSVIGDEEIKADCPHGWLPDRVATLKLGGGPAPLPTSLFAPTLVLISLLAWSNGILWPWYLI